MPFIIDYPAPSPTEYRAGTMPGLHLERGGQQLHLAEALGWVILPGVEGLDDPPRAIIEVEPATWDGSLATDVRFSTRDVFLPLHYQADTTEALREQLRSVAAMLNPRGGDTTLVVTHADGNRRRTSGLLSAPYGTSLEMAEGSLWRRLGLTLRCGDPFWASDTRSRTFQLGGDVAPFLSNEFLPMQVADAQVADTLTVTNPADADAWPVWTVTGPCDSLTIDVAATSWSVPGGLENEEVLIVDSRRGVSQVTVDAVAAWGRLAPGASFGPLAPGHNVVTVDAIGATAATMLTVSWAERWLTAW